MWMKRIKIAGKKYCTIAAVIKPISRLPLTSNTVLEIFVRT